HAGLLRTHDLTPFPLLPIKEHRRPSRSVRKQYDDSGNPNESHSIRRVGRRLRFRLSRNSVVLASVLCAARTRSWIGPVTAVGWFQSTYPAPDGTGSGRKRVVPELHCRGVDWNCHGQGLWRRGSRSRALVQLVFQPPEHLARAGSSIDG